MKTNGENRRKKKHYSVVCTEQFFNGIDGDEVNTRRKNKNNPGYKMYLLLLITTRKK